ncbi:MAG: phosphotransferase, partial [Trebonia sp.]
REELAGELPREIWLIGERLCESLETVAAELRRAPRAVVHGDLHLDNVLFERESVTGGQLSWTGDRSAQGLPP